MAALVEIFNDVVNQRLVQGLNNSEAKPLPAIFEGSDLNIRLRFIEPTNSGRAPFYSLIEPGSLIAYIAIGPRAGTQDIKAFQSSFTLTLVDPETGDAEPYSDWYFSGSLDLNTTELNAAIGSADTWNTFIEIGLQSTSGRRVTYQQPITIQSVVKTPGGAAAVSIPGETYYTRDEMDERFVPWLNPRAGLQLSIISGGSLGQRTWGVEDDGQRIDEARPVAPSTLLTGMIASWDFGDAEGDPISDLHSNVLPLTNNYSAGSGIGPYAFGGSEFNDGSPSTDKEYADIPSEALTDALGTGDWTVAFWLTLANVPGATFPGLWSKEDDNTAGETLAMAFMDGSKKINFRVWDNAGGDQTATSATLSLATWYSVICQYDSVSRVASLYVNNGTPVAATALTNPQDTLVQVPFRWGATSFSLTTFHFLDGSLALGRVWNRLLTAAERQEIQDGTQAYTYDKLFATT